MLLQLTFKISSCNDHWSSYCIFNAYFLVSPNTLPALSEATQRYDSVWNHFWWSNQILWYATFSLFSFPSSGSRTLIAETIFDVWVLTETERTVTSSTSLQVRVQGFLVGLRNQEQQSMKIFNNEKRLITYWRWRRLRWRAGRNSNAPAWCERTMARVHSSR